MKVKGFHLIGVRYLNSVETKTAFQQRKQICNYVIFYGLRQFLSGFAIVTLRYGVLNWGCASKTILEPLKCNLRKAVRIIDSANYTAHSEPIFKRLKLFNFDELYMLETAKMTFQINNNTSNNFLQDEFMKTKNLHKYNTRQSSSEGFSLPSIYTNYKKALLLLIELNSGTPSPQD